MPAEKNPDLHGNAPEDSPVAVVLIDVINDLEFDGGEHLKEAAEAMAGRLARLTERARQAKVPVVYVNDNFGKWRSDLRTLLEHCLNDGVRGEELARLLAPKKEDYFVLKPKHSGFFSTTLDTLLEYLGVKTVIVTGLTTDRCVLFTASDAFVRDLNLVVPKDCCAADSPEHHDQAMEMMRRVLEADIRPSDEIDFDQLARSTSSAGDE
jgi:nicotinamidase-related amidase